MVGGKLKRTLPKHGLSSVLLAFLSFVKKNVVLSVAVVAACITCLVIPPDNAYVGYFDFGTLACLFCTLAVVCAFRNISFFYILARSIVACFGTARTAVIALVFITFGGSMLLANDMALLTFLPLGYFVLDGTGMRKYMAYTFILQNVAANLGGMLTPFGNPQNLYLYSRFNIPTSEFTAVMLPPFLVATVLIFAACFAVGRDKLTIKGEVIRLNVPRTVAYTLLFAFSIGMVFRIVPYLLGIVIVVAALLLLDRKALAQVDYPLLLTFAAFFIFAGNMARIEPVRSFFEYLLGKSTLLFSVLSCQAISNVPSAILLSQFTSDYRDLLVGVNIGGLGTLIASLASLITFREYTKHEPGRSGHYIALFSLVNVLFLAVLLGFQFLYTHFAG